MKKGMKEELELYPDSAREDGDAPECETQAKSDGEERPGPDPRPMMLVYAGPAYFRRKAEHLSEEENNAMMTGIYAGPGFFAGLAEGVKVEKEEIRETEEPETKEENDDVRPAYNQEMPEYVPMDAVTVEAAKKTQEGLDFFCPTCGAKVSLGAKFCPACGASLGALWAEADENLRDSTDDSRSSGKDASDAAGSEFSGGLDSGDIDGDSVNG